MIPGVTGGLLDPARAPLLIAALSVAFFHTLVGVDHYLPFVVLGRARRWSMRKVVAITAAQPLLKVAGCRVTKACIASARSALWKNALFHAAT